MLKLVSIVLFIFSTSEVFAFLPKTFSAEFTQEVESKRSRRARSKKNRVIEGTVEYKFPGHIRFEILRPDPNVYVSNNQTTWYYQAPGVPGGKGQLVIQDAKKNSLHQFFDVLSHGLKTNKFYSVKKEKMNVTLSFSEKFSKRMGIKTSVLSFTKTMDFKNLKEIELEYNKGRKVKMKLASLKVDKKISKTRFSYKAPENTNIIRE